MIVLALDPGKITGWCRVFTASSMVTGGSFDDWVGVVPQINAALPLAGECPPFVVVVERFLLYPWAAKRLKWDKLIAVEVIGVIKYIVEGYGSYDLQLVMQNASVCKSIKLAKYPEGFDRHAKDALRHALAYLKREKLLTEELEEYIAV